MVFLVVVVCSSGGLKMSQKIEIALLQLMYNTLGVLTKKREKIKVYSEGERNFVLNIVST